MAEKRLCKGLEEEENGSNISKEGFEEEKLGNVWNNLVMSLKSLFVSLFVFDVTEPFETPPNVVDL